MSDLLLAAHRDMALRIARGFARKVPPSVELEDLEQAALIGLWKWCSAHPDSSQPGWRGGLVTRIRGAVIDWLRAEDYLPRRARANEGEKLQIIRLEDLSSGDGPGWQDLIGEYEESECDARLDALEALEADMPERERQLVVETFARGRSQKDLALDLGVSEPRVNQLLKRATRTMRDHLERKRDIAPPVSVQVLATPTFRVRDFKRELWLARRNALWQRMKPGMTITGLARELGLPEVTVWSWCNSTKLRKVLVDRSDSITDAVRERGKELIVAALRARGGSGNQAAPLLRISNAALCQWRRRLIPEAPTCSRGPRSRVESSTLAALHARKLSCSQIGREVGLSKPRVREYLAQLGLPRNDPRLRPDVTASACSKLRSEGLTHRQVAQRLACSTQLVRARLRVRAA